MNSQEYWENRKARELYTELEKAEATAKEMQKVYILASSQIKQEAESIIKRFQTKHHLTEAEAKRLLSQIKNKNDLQELIRALKQDPQNADLVAEFESQAYAARLNRLTATQAAVDAVAVQIISAALPKTRKVLKQIGESVYYHELFGIQQRARAGFAVTPLDPKRITKVLNTRWSGANFSKRLWGNTERLAADVKSEILLEILTGKRQHDIASVIDGRFSVGYNETRRLVRTESCYVANQMQTEAYKDAGVEKYIYVAILDLRTSQICRSLDKKVFKVSEATVGVNYPPMHPWCRSTTIAWMPEAILKKLKQRAWDPVNGKSVIVPGDMKYKDWYKQFVKEAQDEKVQSN